MSLRFKIVAVTTVIVIAGVTVGARWFTDLLWFTELGYRSVFLTVLLSRLTLFTGLWVVCTGLLWSGWLWALRRLPVFRSMAIGQLARFMPPRLAPLVLLGIAAAVGGIVAYNYSSLWFPWRLMLAAGNQGIADPIFGRDLSFYLFSLPLIQHGLTLVTSLLFLITLGGGALLALGGAFEFTMGRLGIVQRARSWAGLILALWFVVKAVDYRIRAYSLLYSSSGTTYGPGFTEVRALLPVLSVLTALCLVGALFVLVFHQRRGIVVFVAPVVVVAAVSLIGGSVYPAAVQQFRVSPNELAMEREYIEYNILFSRQAYGLDRLVQEPYEINDDVELGDILQHKATLDNVRLWDWRPLLQTYKQLQEIRSYYNFSDVDVDRYIIDGRLRQVMVSARELNQEQLDVDARNWINLRLKFTHGYGVVASPSNEFDTEGLPQLWVQDVPSRSLYPEFELNRPEIYYGEQTTGYVIVNTQEAEFSYPSGDQNVYTHYEGQGGVQLDSLLVKLAFASRLSSYRILLSDAITADSRIMVNRDLMTRVRTLAPFLSYDNDPYLVVADGRLFWIIDAYTVSDRYPYARPYRDSINYIRNSVKVVVDAYNGDVSFYVAEQEPIIDAMATVFPDLFQPISAMPEYLRAHIRVPEFLYSVMAEMLTLYHMRDPVVFYNREDLWRIPNELYGGRERRMEPYYVIMTLPGEQEPEFVLILPFTPTGRENMIGLLTARCDGEHYGEFKLYQFPKERMVYGPMQIEARISQDADISQKLTLWGQSGSEVIRGNLLVIPIQNTLLYIEPLYLQSTETRLPELKTVIGSWRGRVVMADTLDEVLRQLFTRAPQTADPEQPAEEDATTADLVRRAANLLRDADARMRAGDWAGYGKAMTELKALLTELEQRYENQ